MPPPSISAVSVLCAASGARVGKGVKVGRRVRVRIGAFVPVMLTIVLLGALLEGTASHVETGVPLAAPERPQPESAGIVMRERMI